jgi:hypothetical protein
MPIFTGCSARARIGNGATTALAAHAKPALRMARRPIRRACGNAAFRAFGHKLSAPDQPDQSLVALAYVGKALDGMRRRHRDEERNQARATTIAARGPGRPSRLAPWPAGRAIAAGGSRAERRRSDGPAYPNPRLESANGRYTATSGPDIRLWETWSRHRTRDEVADNWRCFAASIG